MFYIVVEAQDGAVEVGRYEELATAHRYGDSIGNFFSDSGVRFPQNVRVRIENADQSIQVITDYYNGFCRQVSAKGV